MRRGALPALRGLPVPIKDLRARRRPALHLRIEVLCG